MEQETWTSTLTEAESWEDNCGGECWDNQPIRAGCLGFFSSSLFLFAAQLDPWCRWRLEALGSNTCCCFCCCCWRWWWWSNWSSKEKEKDREKKIPPQFGPVVCFAALVSSRQSVEQKDLRNVPTISMSQDESPLFQKRPFCFANCEASGSLERLERFQSCKKWPKVNMKWKPVTLTSINLMARERAIKRECFRSKNGNISHLNTFLL